MFTYTLKEATPLPRSNKVTEKLLTLPHILLTLIITTFIMPTFEPVHPKNFQTLPRITKTECKYLETCLEHKNTQENPTKSATSKENVANDIYNWYSNKILFSRTAKNTLLRLVNNFSIRKISNRCCVKHCEENAEYTFERQPPIPLDQYSYKAATYRPCTNDMISNIKIVVN